MKPILYISSLLILLISGCESKHEITEAKAPFCLTDTLQKKITIDEVKSETVKNSISLSGKIEANEDKRVKVYPVVGGIVEQLKVQLGDYVRKGQVLAVIRSSEIADYQGQLSNARSNVSTAQKTYSTNEEMTKAGLATERDVIASQNELQKAKADLRRIQQTVSIYGGRGNAIQTITAPMAGYVVEKNVTDKMQYRVDANQPFFIISNLDEVWVMASVFESDISRIKVGYDAEVNVIAYNDKTFRGKVDRIFSFLDPQSRVMKVRIRIPNTEGLLKPEMFAKINITYDEGSVQMPAIPAQAVIFDKNKNYVMVYKDKCKIETREIELYETMGNVSYIKSGLALGEKIISKYQLLVYDSLND
jgi:cobalt-zinc-cadmium efflux system membrane fusion protein